MTHHLSYEPEITVIVCWRCHMIIHKLAELSEMPQIQQDVINDWVKQYGDLWKHGREKHLKNQHHKEYEKEYGKKYRKTDTGKESQKKYRKTNKHRNVDKKYQKTDKYKKYRREYTKTDKHKEYQKRYRDKNIEKLRARARELYHKNKKK